jgi:hypothetical protein
VKKAVCKKKKNRQCCKNRKKAKTIKKDRKRSKKIEKDRKGSKKIEKDRKRSKFSENFAFLRSEGVRPISAAKCQRLLLEETIKASLVGFEQTLDGNSTEKKISTI